MMKVMVKRITGLGGAHIASLLGKQDWDGAIGEIIRMIADLERNGDTNTATELRGRVKAVKNA